MSFTLPKLPYTEDALAPHISHDTVKYHYGTHTKKYFDTLNTLIKNTKFEKFNAISDVILSDLLDNNTTLYNNVCQAFNHDFFWKSLCATSDYVFLSGTLLDKIEQDFGSYEDFKKVFTQQAMAGFGSYWTWLCINDHNKLIIKNTRNATTPLTTTTTPLLTIDMWEHSYYLDYKADKQSYINNWWNIINWNAVLDRYKEHHNGKK